MCDCITKVNEQLKPYSTAIDVTIIIQPIQSIRAKVTTYIPFDAPRKHGQKPMSLTATYCPFCGEKYESAP